MYSNTEKTEIPYGPVPGPEIGFSDGSGDVAAGEWKQTVVEFFKGAAEMSVEFGKGVRDVIKQNLLTKDSFFMRNIGGPCLKAGRKMTWLNEYLPEDRDPTHAWSVIACIFIVAVAALFANTGYETNVAVVKRLYIHPRNATRILLPDGRHLAYLEQGVPEDGARFSIIGAHSFLSSRLAGIPGIKALLLQEFGIRLITYDLPGFGESDPHPGRNLESSALDMLQLSYIVGVTDQFWVLGYSGGSMHAWAALRYIPDRVAGAVMVAPMVNPYAAIMTKKESSRIWGSWTSRRKFTYFLARRFPRFLAYFYKRSFLSGDHGQIDEWLSLSLGERDKVLVEQPKFEEFWQRDVEESVRQRNIKPFVEEAVLLVSNWGFKLSDLRVQKKPQGKGIILWLKSLYRQVPEEVTGFLGPIHIWQGMEDKVVPHWIADFVQRVLPGAMVHKLLYDGHFTYFYFCDECNKQMFTTLFGNPQGSLPSSVTHETRIEPIVDQTRETFIETISEEIEEAIVSDLVMDSDLSVSQ